MGPPARWWWVRHAPMPDPATLAGQLDLDCLDPAPAAIAWLKARLPAGARWIASPLLRARRTADALGATGLRVDPRLMEQHFGDWQGRSFAALETAGDPHLGPFWTDPALNAPPGGESFADLCARVAAAVAALSDGGDIVAVAHAGTVRAALADALGLPPTRALGFEVAPLSLTRLDRFATEEGPVWRVGCVNTESP